MGIRLLVDVSLGRRAEEWLQATEHDVVIVRDIDPTLLDSDILQRAFKDNRIIVTLDKDFGELVYRTRQSHAGVLLLRLVDQTGTHKIQILSSILRQYADDIPGHFCVYQDGRFRIR